MVIPLKFQATLPGVLLLLSAAVCRAQEPASNSPVELLDRLAGRWVLQGTIAGKERTHDVDAQWVLKGEYLRLHEVSRDKDDKGDPRYEAIIFIDWDPKNREYACLWLDSTEGGGLSAQGIAHGKKLGDSIPFLFALSPSDSIHNTFTYDRRNDAWQWRIENDVKGKREPFADLKLVKAH